MSDERSYNLILVVALAAVLSVNDVCPAADITLRPRLETISGLIRLGDVADIAAESDAEAARLARLPLMPAPAPGTQTTITAQGVRELVVASGEDLDTLRFSGAIRVTIGDPPAKPAAPARRTFAETPPAKPTPRTRPSTGFRQLPPRRDPATRRDPAPRRARPTLSPSNAAKLTTGLGRQLTEAVQRLTGDPMMQALSPEIEPRHLESLSQAASDVDVSTTTRVATGRQRFLVSFDTADGQVRFPVYADVQPATPAVFVVRSVPRGEMLTRADVEVRPLPIDTRPRAGVTLFASVDEVIGREAGSPLRPGTPLHDANCLPPMLVRRGEEVTVVASGEGVRVRMKVRARANGRLGEIVPVETYDRDERVMARVVGPRELAVLSSSGGAYTASLPRRVR